MAFTAPQSPTPPNDDRPQSESQLSQSSRQQQHSKVVAPTNPTATTHLCTSQGPPPQTPPSDSPPLSGLPGGTQPQPYATITFATSAGKFPSRIMEPYLINSHSNTWSMAGRTARTSRRGPHPPLLEITTSQIPPPSSPPLSTSTTSSAVFQSQWVASNKVVGRCPLLAVITMAPLTRLSGSIRRVRPPPPRAHITHQHGRPRRERWPLSELPAPWRRSAHHPGSPPPIPGPNHHLPAHDAQPDQQPSQLRTPRPPTPVPPIHPNINHQAQRTALNPSTPPAAVHGRIPRPHWSPRLQSTGTTSTRALHTSNPNIATSSPSSRRNAP